MSNTRKPGKSKFPLTLHPTGQWCKKIRGKLHYFGTDKQQAHKGYLAVASHLHGGHPRPHRIEGSPVSVKIVANRYMAYQEARLSAGEISPKHFRDCHDALDIFLRGVGAHTSLGELTIEVLLTFRAGLMRKYAPATCHRQFAIIRAMFNYALDSEQIDRLPPVKKGLAPVSVKQLRSFQIEKRRKHGPRLFTPEQLRLVLAKSSGPLKAMILLGVNGGFGNKDCAELRTKDVDFTRALIDFPRPKTGIRRTVPLWPETLAAIQEAVKSRPQPKLEEDADLAFLTPRGYRWVRTREIRENGELVKIVRHDELNKQFDRILEDLGLKRIGLGFYALRHTHATLADRARDLHAQRRIMGHAIPGMLSEYIEDIELTRLQSVTEQIRATILGVDTDLPPGRDAVQGSDRGDSRGAAGQK